ncbi:nucleotide exchange factor GrpE [Microgenomates group bacterium RBG_19FT_COMBO_39_10]|nr:MAG: nucleotide exchange factor GrpE [Microgenomates group bacterium RBG_19FT_COMBO_39_10]
MTKKKVKGTEKKLEELENRLKRVLADYANLEKRITREKEEFVKQANAQLLDKLLVVLDDLELCEKHLKDKGVSLICARFQTALVSEGVKEIETQGEKFDPETMDAVEIVPGPKNQVVNVVLKGYKLNDKVLRPAKVKVGRGKGK